MQNLNGRVFLITGAGGAIAGPIVDVFAKAGAKLALVERDAARIADRAEAHGALGLPVDLTTVEGAAEMVRAALARFGQLDGLIHTVGGFAMGKLADSDPAVYDRMFDLNVRTLFYALRAVLPELTRRGAGFIAGFSSLPGWTGSSPQTALYGATKSAVATLLRSLDGELAGTGVRTTILYPMGTVDTPANRKDMPGVDPKTFIDPVAIAETLRFAASLGPRAHIPEIPVYPA